MTVDASHAQTAQRPLALVATFVIGAARRAVLFGQADIDRRSVVTGRSGRSIESALVLSLLGSALMLMRSLSGALAYVARR